MDREGRAAGVRYLKGGETYIQPASVVLLAGYTYENTRITSYNVCYTKLLRDWRRYRIDNRTFEELHGG